MIASSKNDMCFDMVLKWTNVIEIYLTKFPGWKKIPDRGYKLKNYCSFTWPDKKYFLLSNIIIAFK